MHILDLENELFTKIRPNGKCFILFLIPEKFDPPKILIRLACELPSSETQIDRQCSDN